MPIPDLERYVCTSSAPWDESKGRFAQHPDAETTYEGSEHTSYECPHCKARWDVYDEDIR